MTEAESDLWVSPVENELDLQQANYCASEAFGRQTKDALWRLTHQGWDTEGGQAKNARSMIKEWQSTTTNRDGHPNAVYLKATLPDARAGGERRVVGLAIWKQLSFVPGCGDAFTDDVTEALGECSEADRRFATQMFRSLWKRRIERIQQVSAPDSGHNPPAIFTLDLCAVDPAFQRRGIAAKLVLAGLEEAKKRGGLECTTEGSSMGRTVYRRLGFEDEGTGDIVYHVDEEFQTRDKPPNVFLRMRRRLD